MCRLLALIEPDPLLQEHATAQFGALADCGVVPPGTSPGHTDGWGTISYKNGEVITHDRQPKSAFENQAFQTGMLKVSAPSLLVAHLRKASSGSVSLENTQPFAWNACSLAHNGTIHNFEKLKLTPEFQLARRGTSDSEVLFLWLVQKMHGRPDEKETFARAAEHLAELSYTAENLLFTDGTFLFALRQANEKEPFVEKNNLCDAYYTLYLGKQDGKTKVVCSQKLDLPGLMWSEIPNHAFAMINLENGTEETVRV